MESKNYKSYGEHRMLGTDKSFASLESEENQQFIRALYNNCRVADIGGFSDRYQHSSKVSSCSVGVTSQ